MPTGRRGGEDAAASLFKKDSFDRLTVQDYFLTSQLGHVAEVGWSEAKVLGDLSIGISPTAPRFHFSGVDRRGWPLQNLYDIVSR